LPDISGGYIFKFDWSAAQEPLIQCTGSPVIQHRFGQCPTEGAGQFPPTQGGCEGDPAPGPGGGFAGGGFGGGGFGGAAPMPTGANSTAPEVPTCWGDLEVVDPKLPNVEQTAYLTEYITAFNDTLHQEPLGAYADYIDVA